MNVGVSLERHRRSETAARHRGVPFASTNDPVGWALGLNDVDSVETDWGKILCVCNAFASSLLRNPAASVGSKRMANRTHSEKESRDWFEWL
jgi:hypothetical protein